MPKYRFVGWSETVMQGLAHAGNAILHRDGHGQPDGSTVVAQPGDEITTAEPYPHTLMVNLETGKPDIDVDPPALVKAPRKAAKKAAKPKLTVVPPPAEPAAATPAPSDPTPSQE